MIRAPGTKRWAALPVPDDVDLRLKLLGVNLTWDGSQRGWMIVLPGVGNEHLGAYKIAAMDVMEHGWDHILAVLADTFTKSRYPGGWNGVVNVKTLPIPAASVIDEEAFNEQSKAS